LLTRLIFPVFVHLLVISPAKEIDDPNDFKPADWVDEAKIQDPEATFVLLPLPRVRSSSSS
jgi:hypothetical protein